MITPTYTASTYDPSVSYARYVRASDDGYWFCEVDPVSRLDVRQGRVDPWDLSVDVQVAADARAGFYPPYVEWPR